MAAVSAPQATDVTTTSDSQQGDLGAWKFPNTVQPKLPEESNPSSSENSNFQPSNPQAHKTNPSATSLEISLRRVDINNPSTFAGNALLSTLKYASTSKNSSISDSGSANDSLLELYGPKRGGMNSVDLGSRLLSNGNESKEDDALENSRWIHRDKLARIENQELQAAGIIIPKTRTASLSSTVRRKHSREMHVNNPRNDLVQKRLQAENLPPDEADSIQNNRWDLRSPEEISENGYTDASVGARSVSRIPVCVKSPLPIPMVHLERDTPLQRKKSSTWAGQEEGISYSKSRGRSGSVKDVTNTTPHTARAASESSKQKKPALRNRSASAHLVSTQRPQTRSGPSTKRPSSRSNEITLAANKRPEGDPPWLSTMYKPDPRLPPEEQLLPTVAKRLQQEQWEKEGTYGNTYDTSFRPLNDQPLGILPSSHEPSKKRTPEKEPDAEWPLRSSKLSPTISSPTPITTGGYSTMPKIIDPSPTASVLPSPRPQPLPQPPPVEEKKKRKCAGCAIM